MRVIAVSAAVTGLVGVLAADASAHEHRVIANGQYEIEVGLINEPAFTGVQNGLHVEIRTLGGAATPVLGMESSVQAEVIYGDQTMALPLTPAAEPGVYESIFFPTAAGDYSFRLVGAIEGTAIDETLTSSPEGFDAVQDRTQFEFPTQSASQGGTIAATLAGDTGGPAGGTVAVGLALGALVAPMGLRLLRRLTSHRRPAAVPVGVGAGIGD